MTQETTSETRRGPATLEDVARRAGVNKYTVSAVLNGFKSNTRVSEETRKRILLAVEELHYQPNAIARSLRRRRTDVIGVYNGTMSVYGEDPFFAMILEGLQRGSQELDIDLLMHGRQPGKQEDGRGQMLSDGKVDGFVMVAFNQDPFVQWLIQTSVPAVAMADAVSGLPSVVVDDYAGGRMQAEHLANRGHKHVLYRTMPVYAEAPLHPTPLASIERRQKAFTERAQELGMNVTLWPSSDGSGYVYDQEVPLLLPPQNRPTAVACCNDVLAYRLMYFCNVSNIETPQDLAVIGFDGLRPIVPYHYDLTTIRAPWPLVAYTAVSTLVDVVKGAPTAAETTLPVELHEGTTT